MDILFRFEAKCPHCGFNNRVGKLKDEYGNLITSVIVQCNQEEGGCPEIFAAFIPWRVMCSTATIGRERIANE